MGELGALSTLMTKVTFLTMFTPPSGRYCQLSLISVLSLLLTCRAIFLLAGHVPTLKETTFSYWKKSRLNSEQWDTEVVGVISSTWVTENSSLIWMREKYRFIFLKPLLNSCIYTSGTLSFQRTMYEFRTHLLKDES